MQKQGLPSKPNVPINIVLFVVMLVGGPPTFWALTMAAFFVALPVAMFAKSMVIKSAAASALAGALVVWIAALIYYYIKGE